MFWCFGLKACGVLAPLSRIGRQSPNHWATREVPKSFLVNIFTVFPLTLGATINCSPLGLSSLITYYRYINFLIEKLYLLIVIVRIIEISKNIPVNKGYFQPI